jgi:hypothetical protein
MKLSPPLIRRLDQPLRCYVCHRGVEPALVQEIAVYFREKGYAVIVQSGDGLALSFSEFRRAALAHLAAGCDNLVVLLNKNFSSPIYRHTLGVVEAKAERELPAGHSYVIRIEDGGDADSVWVDLSDADTPEVRREILLKAWRWR